MRFVNSVKTSAYKYVRPLMDGNPIAIDNYIKLHRPALWKFKIGDFVKNINTNECGRVIAIHPDENMLSFRLDPNGSWFAPWVEDWEIV